MKRLTCEMCGSTDLIKEGGVFVCQSCGCKYSVEEAKKMMIEGTVEITGTVKVDHTKNVENYLAMARNAMKTTNIQGQKEAEEYANKVLELDSNNWEAWLIKGKAASGLSSFDNFRLSEVIGAFKRSIDSYPVDNEVGKKALINECRQQLSSSYRFFMEGINEVHQVAHGHPSDDDFDWFIEQYDKVICGFNLVLTTFGTGYDDAAINQIIIETCQNIIPCHKALCSLQAYHSYPGSFGTRTYIRSKHLTDAAVEIQNSEIIKLEKIMKEAQIANERITAEKQHKEQEKQIAEAKRKREEQAREMAEKQHRREVYWREHSAEKAEIDTKLQALQQKKYELEKGKKEYEARLKKYDEELSAPVPAEESYQEWNMYLEQLEQEKSALGLFKGKEKKAIQVQIDDALQELERIKPWIDQQRAQLEAEVQEKIDAIHVELNPILERIEEINKEIANINTELTKDR